MKFAICTSIQQIYHLLILMLNVMVGAVENGEVLLFIFSTGGFITHGINVRTRLHWKNDREILLFPGAFLCKSLCPAECWFPRHTQARHSHGLLWPSGRVSFLYAFEVNGLLILVVCWPGASQVHSLGLQCWASGQGSVQQRHLGPWFSCTVPATPLQLC